MIGVQNWDNPQRAARFGEYVQVVEELLRTSRCTFAGEFYTVERAAVHPPVQDPRPPITVAAMGPRMMRYAAAHADTWNTMSFGAGAESLLADAAALKSRMAAVCEAEGRDPSTIRHSFLLFDADARDSGGRLFYWESAAAFEDVAGQIFEMGYDEVGAYYPIDEQRPAMEDAAATVIPSLRS